MIDVTPNIPEVVAEVRDLFERYEQALVDKNVDVLDATFWNSPHTIRYALHENGYGFDEIHAHRVARPPGPGIKERRIRLEILTLGRDLATVNLEFKVRGRDLVGRQSQTWVRFPDLGWKVIAAHVSTMSETPPWVRIPHGAARPPPTALRSPNRRSRRRGRGRCAVFAALISRARSPATCLAPRSPASGRGW